MKRRSNASGYSPPLGGLTWGLGLALALIGWTIRMTTYGPRLGIPLGWHAR